MKSKVYATTLLAAFLLAGISNAQDTVAPAPASRPVANTPLANPAADASPDNPFAADADQVRRQADQVQQQAAQVRQQADQMRQTADQVRAQVEYAAKEAADSVAAGQRWAYQPSLALANPGFLGISGHSESEGTLVIRTSDPDANALANAQEDLNIMGRILEKAVAQKAEDDQPQAMGIRLLTLAGHPSLRNLQIEGFGDIFFLNVNFPLVGPARSTGNNDEKQPSNSTWDEAKRELYGPAPGAEGFNESSSKEAYDPKQVEKLKDIVLQALKNATNIRSLKLDESVMVVVNGGNGGGWSELGMALKQKNRFRSAPAGLAGSAGGGFGTGGAGGTPPQPGYTMLTQRHVHVMSDGSVLTIRSKKSDIDAFASGKLDLDEFRNKVKIVAYPTLVGTNPDQPGLIIPQTK